MPNIKSAKKRVLVSANKQAQNRMIKTRVKTSIKKADIAAAMDENAQAAFQQAQTEIDRAVAKGILHKNTAARRKSRLARQLAK